MIISSQRKEQLYKAHIKHRYTHQAWATKLKNKALQRAKTKNLEFDLTKDFILKKLEKGICEVTKLPLNLNGGTRKPLTPSLDRINPNFGYTKDNVQLVCCMYNFAKSDFTYEDVLQMAQALVENK